MKMEVPIAAFFVDNQQHVVLASAYNATNAERDATRHAEIILLERLYAQGVADFRSLTLYVTIEPCVMCASALIHAGIGRIVYGANNDKFGGCGSVLDVPSLMNATNVTIDRGLFADYAVELLRRFYVHGNTLAPRPHRQSAKALCSQLYGESDTNGPTTREVLRKALEDGQHD